MRERFLALVVALLYKHMEGLVGSKEITDLLLEDYRHFSSELVRSEQAGETRTSLFIGLVTFCAGAVGAGYGKTGFPPEALKIVAFATSVALLIIGVLILFRMIIRMEKTDLAKRQLDLIRQTFMDRIDNCGAFSAYDLFPKMRGRRFGGLSELIATINAIIAIVAILFAGLVFGAESIDIPLLAALAAGAALWAVQIWYVIHRRDAFAKVLADGFPRITHAGALVYRLDEGRPRYLVIRPKSGKDEWVLPKGHVEPARRSAQNSTQSSAAIAQEGHAQAALRELAEETGVIAKVRGVIGTICLSAAAGEPQWAKFFLLEKTSEGLSHEERGSDWLSVSDALAKLTYQESKKILTAGETLRHQLSVVVTAN